MCGSQKALDELGTLDGATVCLSEHCKLQMKDTDYADDDCETCMAS